MLLLRDVGADLLLRDLPEDARLVMFRGVRLQTRRVPVAHVRQLDRLGYKFLTLSIAASC